MSPTQEKPTPILLHVALCCFPFFAVGTFCPASKFPQWSWTLDQNNQKEHFSSKLLKYLSVKAISYQRNLLGIFHTCNPSLTVINLSQAPRQTGNTSILHIVMDWHVLRPLYRLNIVLGILCTFPGLVPMTTWWMRQLSTFSRWECDPNKP